MSLPWTPRFFVHLPFHTSQPSFAPFTQTPKVKRPFDRKLVTQGHKNRKRRQPTLSNEIERWNASIAAIHGVWASPYRPLAVDPKEYNTPRRPTAWDSWDSFFNTLRKNTRLEPYYRALVPLQHAARVVGRIPYSLPDAKKCLEEKEREGLTECDLFSRGYHQYLTGNDPILGLVSKARIGRLINRRLKDYDRLNVGSIIETQLDFPMILLGCLAACIESPTFIKASGLGLAYPIGKMLREASKEAKSGMFWLGWTQFAMSSFGAPNQRQWARMLTPGMNLGKAEINAQVKRVNRWMRGKKNPGPESIQEAFDAHPFHEVWNQDQKVRAKAAWIGLGLLTFNLELTLSQYRRLNNDIVPEEAFALAEKSRRFFTKK